MDNPNTYGMGRNKKDYEAILKTLNDTEKITLLKR
jgi:hypothetical protein